MVTPDPGPKFQNYEEVALWQGIDTAGQAPRIADHGSRLHNIYSNTNMLFILGQEKSMQTDSKEGIVVSRGNPPTWVLFLTLIMSTDKGPVLNSSSSFFPCFSKGKGKTTQEANHN